MGWENGQPMLWCWGGVLVRGVKRMLMNEKARRMRLGKSVEERSVMREEMLAENWLGGLVSLVGQRICGV